MPTYGTKQREGSEEVIRRTLHLINREDIVHGSAHWDEQLRVLPKERGPGEVAEEERAEVIYQAIRQTSKVRLSQNQTSFLEDEGGRNGTEGDERHSSVLVSRRVITVRKNDLTVVGLGEQTLWGYRSIGPQDNVQVFLRQSVSLSFARSTTANSDSTRTT